MILRLLCFVLPLTLAAVMALTGCAGSKSHSSSSGSSEGMTALKNADEKTSKLEEARRSAEDAELKAHQLREEKARNQTKTSSSN